MDEDPMAVMIIGPQFAAEALRRKVSAMTGEQGTTSWYVCKKCGQPCDVKPPVWNFGDPALGEAVPAMSSCCYAPVRVASSKTGDGG